MQGCYQRDAADHTGRESDYSALDACVRKQALSPVLVPVTDS
jgi:hypothetical protein